MSSEPPPEVDRLLDAARSGDAAGLDALAHEAHLSRYHLSRLLKKHLGFPLRDFLAASRVDRGIASLVEGHDVTRSQVDAGHESASSYTQAFAKHTGLAPSRYRGQMRALARHLTEHMAAPEAMAILHRRFQPSEHAQPHPLSLCVTGASERAALFVALHPTPIVHAAPVLGIALLGACTYEVTAIPDGSYYAMVVEVPRGEGVRPLFHMRENRRALDRTPISFPLTAPVERTLALRPIMPTDPPITVNLPRLFFEAAPGRLSLEVRNSGQAPGGGAA